MAEKIGENFLKDFFIPEKVIKQNYRVFFKCLFAILIFIYKWGMVIFAFFWIIDIIKGFLK